MKVFTQTLFRHEFITLDGLRLQMEVRLILPQPVVEHFVSAGSPKGAAVQQFESSLCKGMIAAPKPWIRGSPKSMVVDVAHTGAQAEYSSQGGFMQALEG